MGFNIEGLKRDWIRGISEQDFLARVDARRLQLDLVTEHNRLRGVLIAEENPIAFASAFFAALDLEIPIILANVNWGEKEWEDLFSLVDPVITFGLREKLRAFGGSSTKSDYPLIKRGSILIPTGGTTGGIKLAVHNWASLQAAVLGLQSYLGVVAINSACQLPLYHVSGLMQLVRSFITGGSIHFDGSVEEGDCLSLVPTQLQRALNSSDEISKFRKARAIFVGGSRISESTALRASELRLPLMPVYGMTETAAMVAAVPSKDFLQNYKSSAIPIGDALFSIEEGQIRVQTPALFQGYHGCESINLSRGFLTGDEGSLDDAGRLYVFGRMDRIINTGGEKVDPIEVEAVLEQIKGIKAARVYAEPDPYWGEAVIAQVSCDSDFDVDKLRYQLKGKLSNFKVPQRFEILK